MVLLGTELQLQFDILIDSKFPPSWKVPERERGIRKKAGEEGEQGNREGAVF